MVNRLRLVRETKAIAFLRQQRFAASALEIGVAAISGEARAPAIPLKAKEAIGLNIAVELVRRKLAKVTRENRFYRATRGGHVPEYGLARRSKPRASEPPNSAVASERLAVESIDDSS
jgi:hypothetical protein